MAISLTSQNALAQDLKGKLPKWEEPAVAISARNLLTAQHVKDAGFDALWVSGFEYLAHGQYLGDDLGHGGVVEPMDKFHSKFKLLKQLRNIWSLLPTPKL